MEQNQGEKEKLINWNLLNPKRTDCISVHIYMEVSYFFKFIREEISPFSRDLREDSRLKGFHLLCYPKSESYITLRIFSDDEKAFFDDIKVKMKIETYLELDYTTRIVREDYDLLEGEYGNKHTKNGYEEWLSNNSKFLMDIIDYKTSKMSIPNPHNNLDIDYSFFIYQLVHIFLYQAGVGQNEVQLALINAKSRVINMIGQDFDRIIQKYNLNNLYPINFKINN
jgi:hypothetical protein